VVAVKKLQAHWIEFAPTVLGEFELEVKFLKTIRHPNIVLFYGAGYSKEGPFLVTEFVPHGSLSDMLRSHNASGQTFPWKQKIEFCQDAAKGLEFLHSLTPTRIHRDIKPQNLLVTKNLRIQIADFGTSKLSQTSKNEEKQPSLSRSSRSSSRSNSVASTSGIGTILYMAPELMAKGKIIYGTEVDVYSFGVTMWVIANNTGEDPYAEVGNFVICDHVMNGNRPPVSPDWPSTWTELMTRCWTAQPVNRPSFVDIVAALHDMHT